MTTRDLAAIQARVRASFERQGAMRLIGARLVRVDAGEVEIELPFSAAVTQQHGFVHGGIVVTVLDTACGFAAYSLMAPEAEPLTIEIKHSFLAPARGERFTMIGRVRKAGRTVSFCEAEGHAHENGERRLIGTTTATIMTVIGRTSVRQAVNET